jgi:hypothetical protein
MTKESILYLDTNAFSDSLRHFEKVSLAQSLQSKIKTRDPTLLNNRHIFIYTRSQFLSDVWLIVCDALKNNKDYVVIKNKIISGLVPFYEEERRSVLGNISVRTKMELLNQFVTEIETDEYSFELEIAYDNFVEKDESDEYFMIHIQRK